MKTGLNLIKGFLNSKVRKISNFSNSLRISKIKKNFSFKNLYSLSFITQLSKTEKYQSILEKLNQFKIDEVNKKRLKKSKKQKNKNAFLFIREISAIQKYKEILKNILFKKKNVKIKKSKSLKSHNISYKFINTFLNNFELFSKFKTLKLFAGKSLQNNINKDNKFDQKIGVLFYGDHNLIFLSLIINLNNKVKVTGVTEIPIPGNVIGDTLVEDSNELANIALDSINLLDLNSSPLLVVLSSSFFNIHTFQASDLKQISQSDSKVQSKSPYLPANTLVDFLRMSDRKISNGFIRTIYSKKDFINGWTDTLEMINLPIIGLIPAAPHIFDSITEKIIEENTILIDIEDSSTTLLIGSKLAKLNSYKLPFGSSIYLSENMRKSSKSYFDRALNSIKLIMNENNEKIPTDIFVMGSGLDKLSNASLPLPKGFKSISQLELSDFSYFPNNMDIHELISPSINSSIHSLTSILASCV